MFRKAACGISVRIESSRPTF